MANLDEIQSWNDHHRQKSNAQSFLASNQENLQEFATSPLCDLFIAQKSNHPFPPHFHREGACWLSYGVHMDPLCLWLFSRFIEVCNPLGVNQACCQISIAKVTRNHPLYHLKFLQECRIDSYEQKAQGSAIKLDHSWLVILFP